MDQTLASKPASWAIVELMGHVAISGRITKPGENGGLWQLDIPDDQGSYHTEFFGSQSVYRIRMVSEEIARAYAPQREVIEYNAPIITREEHESILERFRERYQSDIQALQNQLRNALPAATLSKEDAAHINRIATDLAADLEEDYSFDEEDDPNF